MGTLLDQLIGSDLGQADTGPSDAGTAADPYQVDLASLGFGATGPMVPSGHDDQGAAAYAPSQSPNPSTGTPIYDSSMPQAGPSSGMVKATARGFSAPAYGRVLNATRGPDAQADRGARADAAAYEDAGLTDVDRAYGLGDDAARQESAAKSNIAAAKYQVDLQRGKLQDQFAGDEQQAAAVTSARTAQAEANYRMALTSIPMMDDRKWYHDKSTWGKLGSIAAAFVGGVLNAKGVQNQIIPELNKQIDDDLNTQLQNIKTGEHVAEGFKDLYTMARQDGASDAEVRERLRGFYLAKFEANAAGELDKYGSELAKAEGTKNLAELAKQKAQAIANVRQGAFDRYKTEEGMYLTRRGQDMTAATASAELAVKKQELALKTASAKGAIKETLGKLAVNSPFDGSLWRVANSEDSQKELAKIATSSATFMKQAEDLRKLVHDNGAVINSQGWKKWLNSDDGKEILSRYNQLAMTMAESLGGTRGVDAPGVRGQIMSILGDPGKGYNLMDMSDAASFDKTLRSVELRTGQQVDTNANVISHAVTPDEAPYIISGSTPKDKAFGADIVAEIDAQNHPAAKDAIDVATEKASEYRPHDMLNRGVQVPTSHYAEDLAKEQGVPQSYKDYAAYRERLGETGTDSEPSTVPYLDQLALVVTDSKATEADRMRAATALVTVGAERGDGYALYLADKAGVQYDKDALESLRQTGINDKEPLPPGTVTGINQDYLDAQQNPDDGSSLVERLYPGFRSYHSF